MPLPNYRGPRAPHITRRKFDGANHGRFRIHPLFITIVLIVISYYRGYSSTSSSSTPCPDNGGVAITDAGKESENDLINRLVAERTDAVIKRNKELEQISKKNYKKKDKSTTDNAPWPHFPSTVTRLANGMVTIPKDDFHQTFNYGTPSQPLQREGTEDALLIYNSVGSLPTNHEKLFKSHTSGKGGLPKISAKEATQNCAELRVVYQNPDPRKAHCWAAIENYDNYHVQKWITLDDDNGDPSPNKAKPTTPHSLQAVGVGVTADGRNTLTVPGEQTIKIYTKKFQRYLNTKSEVVKELTPIAKRVAGKGNTIVVMTVNYGQADLLANFVCSARRRGLDVGSVLVFATDEKAYRVAVGLGVEAFYDKKNFASLPEKEAEVYGDMAFASMMYAKMISVQLINMMGYDVLFQDVDIVWYKNPIPFLQNYKKDEDKHILLQDDGNRQIRFGDAYGNSGFYYVKSNPYTKYLFTSMLYSGSLLIENKSHQELLNAKISEHASLFGLRVAILDGKDFPCGKQYHQEKDLMKEIVAGKKVPYLFHMSWTENKVNKLLFMKQMGLWYMKEQCMGEDMLNAMVSMGKKVEVEENVNTCCAKEALVSCHYGDTPSIISCKDSPHIDKKAKSFW